MAKKKTTKKKEVDNNILVDFKHSKDFKKAILTFSSENPLSREDLVMGLFKTIEELYIPE
jgi:hypothetical protein